MVSRYLNYDSNPASDLEGLAWFEQKDLARVLREARSNFVNVDQRELLIADLSSIEQNCPYTKVSRFKPGRWVCEDTESWQKIFQQFRISLVHKGVTCYNRMDGARQGPSIKEEPGNGQNVNNDSVSAFYDIIAAMINKIKNRDDSWDRKSFESKFRLVWVESESGLNSSMAGDSATSHQ